MKSLKTISLVAIGTLTIIGTSVLAATGTVNAPSGLVLREEASKTGNPITEVPDKTEVNIVEKSGEWYKVTCSNHEGYLYAEYVNVKEGDTVETSAQPENEVTDTEKQTENSQTAESQPNNGTAAKSKLKVYAIPLITSTVINEIDPSMQITIEKQITNWSYVSTGDISGWVRTYGIENTVETSTEPTVEQPQENPQEQQEEQPEQQETQNEENAETEQTQENTQTEEPEQTTTEQSTETKPSNKPQAEQTVSETKGYVIVDCANVRKEAAKDSEIVTALTKDTSFTIVAETEEWYKIKYTSIDNVVYEGYIFKSLAKK